MKVLFAVLIAMLTAGQAMAQTQWQVRDICDLRKGGGLAGRSAECAQLAAEVLMLLPDKAGPGNVALVADFTDNLEKAQVDWESPCRDQAHCPAAAYTIRYAFVSRKIVEIPKDQVFTALVCREGFSETTPDDAACRLKLMKVVREMAVRARKEGRILAVIKCGGAESEAVRPDGQGVAGYELVYAFVQLPDLLPMAGGDPKAAARQVADQLAGPAAEAPMTAPAMTRTSSLSRPSAPTPSARSVPVLQQAPQPPAGDTVLMQVAALPNLVQAETLADRLAAKGIEATFERAEVNGKEVYRVIAKGKGSAAAFRQRLAEMGYPGAIERR